MSDTIKDLGRLIANAGSADFVRIMFEVLGQIVQIDAQYAAMWSVSADCRRIIATQWFSSMPYRSTDDSKNPLRRCIESADQGDNTLHRIMVADGPQLIYSEKGAPRECIVVSGRGSNRFVICLQRGMESAVYSAQELTLIEALSKVLLPLLERYALRSAINDSPDGGMWSAVPRELPGDLLVMEQEFQRRIDELGLTLSQREREVCVLMLSGYVLPEICERLNIKASTVETYIKRAGLKLGFSGRHGLSRWLVGGGNK